MSAEQRQKTIDALMKFTGCSEAYVKSFLDYHDRSKRHNYIGEYQGVTVYSCSKRDYLAHKDEYDQPYSWDWLIMDDNILVSDGKVIGKVRDIDDGVDRFNPPITVDEFYHRGVVVYEDENVRVIKKC